MGLDAIIHVVSFGRMNAEDRKLPALLLDGLADDVEVQRELANRYVFVVTHADNDAEDPDPAEHEQFRGKMQAFFPESLQGAIAQAMFVEHGPKRGSSPYGDAVANRNQILDKLLEMRQVYHRTFQCRPLADAVETGFQKAMEMWMREMDIRLKDSEIPKEEHAALLHFMAQVQCSQKFMEMTAATTTARNFRTAWNSMNLATRDEVAVRLANIVFHQVKEACDKSWMEFLRGCRGNIYDAFKQCVLQ